MIERKDVEFLGLNENAGLKCVFEELSNLDRRHIDHRGEHFTLESQAKNSRYGQQPLRILGHLVEAPPDHPFNQGAHRVGLGSDPLRQTLRSGQGPSRGPPAQGVGCQRSAQRGSQQTASDQDRESLFRGYRRGSTGPRPTSGRHRVCGRALQSKQLKNRAVDIRSTIARVRPIGQHDHDLAVASGDRAMRA